MSSNPRIPYRMADRSSGLAGPDGKNLIVHLVVNVEAWRFDHAMPRKIITAPQGAEQVPDIPNFSWAEYGMRCGMPRLLDLFADETSGRVLQSARAKSLSQLAPAAPVFNR